MRRADKWMSFYVGDYLRDTGHLTVTEHGAYFLLLIQAWTRDGILPLDDQRLRALARMSAKQWAGSRDTILAFFYRTEEGFRQKRLDAELRKVGALVTQRSEAGAVSAEKRKRKQKQGENSTSVALPLQREHQRTSNENADNHNHSHKEHPPYPQTRPDLPRSSRLPANPKRGDPPQCWLALGDPPHPKSNPVGDSDKLDELGRPIAYIAGYRLDLVADLVCEAASMPLDWHGDWTPLIQWLREGFQSDAIIAAIRRVAAKPGYNPVRSLKYFDGAVRGRP